MDPLAGDPAPADTPTVVAALRRKIIGGEFPPGLRVAEIAVAQALGVSRTPVRLAFRTLEQEGLLEKAGARGYAVRAISEADVRCAIEVRGVLEGLAARHLAERGPTPDELAVLQGCLDEGEAVLAKGRLDPEDIGRWSALNERFHRTLVGSDASRVIADAIARNNHLPFASADSIVIDPQALDREFRKLQQAQLQHQLVVEALSLGESARVESLMREHAWVGFRYGRHFGIEGVSLLASLGARVARSEGASEGASEAGSAGGRSSPMNSSR
jgi:GntR family transcriptional regulator of vanillate catabolism